MLLLGALGSLSVMRSAVEASRTLLRARAYVTPRPGRNREPRDLALHQLIAPLSRPDGALILASLPGQATRRKASLLCAMQSPCEIVLVTAASMIAACVKSRTLLWEVPLEDLLLVQRQGMILRVLCLSGQTRPAEPTGSYSGQATQLHHVSLASAADAERLRELLALATWNARGLACATAAPQPTFLTCLLGPGPRACAKSQEPKRPSEYADADPATMGSVSLFAPSRGRSILARTSPAHAPLSARPQNPAFRSLVNARSPAGW